MHFFYHIIIDVLYYLVWMGLQKYWFMYFFPWFFVLGFFWGGVWGIFNWSSPPLFFVLVCVFIFVFKSKTVFLFCFGLLPTESPVFFTICSANSTIPSRWPQRIIYFFTLLSVILPCFFHCNNFILVGISWVYPLFSSGLSETFSLENMHILQVQTDIRAEKYRRSLESSALDLSKNYRWLLCFSHISTFRT